MFINRLSGKEGCALKWRFTIDWNISANFQMSAGKLAPCLKVKVTRWLSCQNNIWRSMWTHGSDTELHSLSSDQRKRPSPILCPSLIRFNLDEFCLARMLARIPECRTGRPKSRANASSQPLLSDCSVTSSVPEVLIRRNTCEPFDSSVAD